MVENILPETYPYTYSHGGGLHHVKPHSKKRQHDYLHVLSLNVIYVYDKNQRILFSVIQSYDKESHPIT